MAGRNITYNGNSLQTAYILSQDIDMESLPTKDVKIYPVDHANKSVIPFISYPNRTITVMGTLIGDTIADLDSRADAFRGLFIGQEQNLDIDYAGSTRRFIATANKISISRPNGLTYAPFVLEFICSSPFGRATASSSILSATGRTSSSYTDSLTFSGTAPYQQPIITITYTTITTPGFTSVVVSNNSNGQNVTVSHTWNTNDVLQIDSLNKLVTVNGNTTAFFGAFPEFPPGAGVLAYSDGLSSRTFNISVTYMPQYL